MGQRNKAKRDLKKRKKMLKAKQRNQINLDQVSTNKRLYQMDNPFQDLSPEQRKEVLDHMGVESEKKFHLSINELDTIFSKSDPLQLLAMISAYELTVGITDSGVEKSDFGEINQFHAEFCQALILRDKKFNYASVVIPSDYTKLREQLKILSMSLMFRGMSSDKLDMPDAEHAIEGLRRRVMGHTQIVRNWGFVDQVKKITKELFGELDELYLASLGFTATQAISFFESLVTIAETRINVRLKTLSTMIAFKDKRELVRHYYENILGQSPEESEEFINSEIFRKSTARDIFSMLLSHQDLFIKEIYKFEISKLVEFLKLDENCIKKMVEKFSFTYGDLAESPIEYIINDNPIWGKPLIKISDDVFYSFTPQMFFSFVLKTLTNLGESFAKKQIEKRKAKFLENRIEKIVRAKFPENKTFKSVIWSHEGQRYETDLITSIDTCLLIIEAKSGHISSSALRGAPGRLKTHLKELILVPNEQSKRLKEKIFAIQKGEDQSKELEDQLNIDLKTISRVIRLSISLDDFAMIQSNIKQHEETGWLPEDFSPCPSMNVADFETLFNLLDHPLNIIHYLYRREEIEDYVNYQGDELDLMGHYIKTLFDSSYFPNDEKFIYDLGGQSDEIDKYYQSLAEGVILSKPIPELNSFWKSILLKLEERNFSNWTQIGLVLLSIAPKDQKMLTTKIGHMKRNIRKNWDKKGHLNMLVWSPSLPQNTALAFAFFCNNNRSERNKFINAAANSAMSKEHINKCAVIAINIDVEELPYDLVGMFFKGQ